MQGHTHGSYFEIAEHCIIFIVYRVVHVDLRYYSDRILHLSVPLHVHVLCFYFILVLHSLNLYVHFVGLIHFMIKYIL